MGNCIDDYRAAIGIFNSRRRNQTKNITDFLDNTYLEILLTNFKCTLLVFSLSALQSIIPNINIVFLLFVLYFILIIGNVELNPGPNQNDESNTPLINMDNYLTICNINIRSIRNKIEFLQNFTEEFDIVTVTETHLCPNILDRDLELESFSQNIIRKDRNNSGGGVLIYTKDDLVVNRKNEYENPIDETLWVEVRGRGQKFLLCCAYRSNFSDADFWARFYHAIGIGLQETDNIVITGDLNCDLLSPSNNKLTDLMNSFNISNVINKATRTTDHSCTLLDPIIISDGLKCIFSDVLYVSPDISDHDAAIACIECPKSISRSFKREVWLYDKTNIEKFNKLLDEIDWNSLLSDQQDVDEMCTTFTSTFLQVARQCIPTKDIIVRENDKPWFTSELRREIRKRDRLRKSAIKSKKDVDILKYKRQRNRVNNLKKLAKENFEKKLDNIILDNTTNSKTYWKIMKMLIKSNKGTSSVPPLKNIIQDGKLSDIVTDEDEKCELLNKYFNLISTLNEENVVLPNFQKKTEHVVSNINIEINEIIDVIKTLDPNKASGPDTISHRMLKICPEKIAKPLQIIFNKSLEQGKYPSAWKIANVIAIFKRGDNSLPSNYRPISLISCVGKVMERVVYKHVYNHLQKYKLIYEYQSGFLPKNSTVHQLLEIYDCILNALERKEISCFIFCDFSKAFDKVWHKGLLHKLNSYGVDGSLHRWFHDYLNDRKQRVVIKDHSSPLQTITAGVPQGSVLGPLLFIIYINDIAENLISLTRLFADDTSFSCSGPDESEIQTVIDHDLNALNEWSDKWLMSFNPDKTEIMLFTNAEAPNIKVKFNGIELPVSRSHKHLGVTLSSDAKWNLHIENILSSVSRHLNILRKLKYKLSRSNLEKLYLVYIRPIFEYACEVWDNCGDVNAAKLEQMQLDAARIVTGLPIFTRKSVIYKEIGWETLQERRRRRKLQMFYNIQNENAPQYLCKLIPPTIQSTTIYPLRNGNDIIVPYCRLSLTNHSFIPSTIRQWNSLDLPLRNATSLSQFKYELKKLNEKDRNLPKYYNYGPRKLNILLTQFRCSATFLNQDLYRINIISDPSCRCGAPHEDSYHYFFVCPIYTTIRKTLIDSLAWLPDCLNLDLSLLTCGNDTLTDEQNEEIFKNVFHYIKSTKRFLVT